MLQIATSNSRNHRDLSLLVAYCCSLDTSNTASGDSQRFRQVVSAAGTNQGACIIPFVSEKILEKKKLVELDSELRPFVHTRVLSYANALRRLSTFQPNKKRSDI